MSQGVARDANLRLAVLSGKEVASAASILRDACLQLWDYSPYDKPNAKLMSTLPTDGTSWFVLFAHPRQDNEELPAWSAEQVGACALGAADQVRACIDRQIAREPSPYTQSSVASTPQGQWEPDWPNVDIVGYCWTRRHASSGTLDPTVGGQIYVMSMATNPRTRRQGVGRCLVQCVLRAAHDLHCEHTFLHCLRGSAAEALYRSCGFGLRRTLWGYYGPSRDAVELVAACWSPQLPHHRRGHAAAERGGAAPSVVTPRSVAGTAESDDSKRKRPREE